jgi:hypothetical protein
MTLHRRLVVSAALAVIASACTSAPAPVEPQTTSSTTVTTFVPLTSIADDPPAVATTTTTTEAPPPLRPEIRVEPGRGSVVDAYRVEFEVSTDPGLDVFVDGEPISIDDQGEGHVSRVSTPGANTIVVTVSTDQGTTYTERLSYTFEPREGWIALVGDSIMRGAEEEIESRLGRRTVQAVDGRQFWEGSSVVRGIARSRNSPELLVIHLGTNGQVTPEHFDRIMRASEGITDVVFLNLSVPRRWEEANNLELAAGVERYENTRLLDWKSSLASQEDPAALLNRDGVHLNEEGWVVYADFIVDALFPDWPSANN